MKQLFFILVMFAFLSCEKKQDWAVTVVSKVERWRVNPIELIDSNSTTRIDYVLDMSEKEIALYCTQGYRSEMYGGVLYKYFTTKTYVEK